MALYLPQQSSSKAARFMTQYGRPLAFTAWHRLEVRNAIRLAVYHQVIEAPEAATQLKQLETDLKEEALLVHQAIDWTDVLREAEKLGAAHNQKIGCRSADLFHVAAALELDCRVFLTFDGKQTAMAQAAGLRTEP